MVYRTLGDLSNLVRKNTSKIPHDIDLVVGIPRSGMIPAYMVALFLNKRVTDLDSFLDGRIVEAGERSQYIQQSDIRKILIVDDSVCEGNAMRKAKAKLQPISSRYELIFMAPIVTTEGRKYVDIYLETIDDSRVFEWNVFHHGILEHACLDIDGVLNVDPEIDDDGPIYTDFLLHAQPLFLPTVPIGTLISCRLEKYRSHTEQWLREHGIQYKELIMLDMPDKATRVAWGKHGEYKAEYYKNKKDYWFFIESSKEQAEIIAKATFKPVLCVETNELLQYSPKMLLFKRAQRRLHKMFPAAYDTIRNIKICRRR